MEFSDTAIMENENSKKEITEEEIIASQMQSTRILPNILRNNNTKILKNHKVHILDQVSTSVTSNEENINTSFDLNMKLSNIDPEKQDKCDKITSLRSPHQRKQIYDPLNIRRDLPNWNISKKNRKGNENKQVLKRDNQLEISLKSNTSVKKLKYSNKRKHNTRKYLLNKQSRRCIRKSSNKIKRLNKKSSYKTTNTSSVNIKDNVDIRDINEIIDTGILLTHAQSVTEYHTSTFMNTSNNIGIKFDESSDNSYFDDESYHFDTECDINYNTVIDKSAEPITMHNTVQNNVPTYELSYETMMNDSSQERLIDRDNSSNFLLASNMLYSCTCKNCTSYDEDVILYEDPVSSSTNNDVETEFFTPYEFYANDYYHIFDDNWLEELCSEEIQEINVTKKDTCFDNNNIIELIDNNSSILSVKQNESQNLKSHKYIDDTQIANIKLYSEELGINSDLSAQFSKYKDVKNLNDIDYSNLESFSEDDVSSQNKSLNQTTNLITVPKSKYQTPKNNTDLYIAQCVHCRRLFSENHQLTKHLTYCKVCKKRYTCYICNKTYRYKSSLAHHLKKIHHTSYGGYDKFYVCNKCSKLYIRLRAFQRHILLHDNVR